MNILHLFYDKPGVREKASNEDSDTEFLFAYLNSEGANWRCGNMDLLKRTENYTRGWKINP